MLAPNDQPRQGSHCCRDVGRRSILWPDAILRFTSQVAFEFDDSEE